MSINNTLKPLLNIDLDRLEVEFVSKHDLPSALLFTKEDIIDISKWFKSIIHKFTNVNKFKDAIQSIEVYISFTGFYEVDHVKIQE